MAIKKYFLVFFAEDDNGYVHRAYWKYLIHNHDYEKSDRFFSDRIKAILADSPHFSQQELESLNLNRMIDLATEDLMRRVYETAVIPLTAATEREKFSSSVPSAASKSSTFSMAHMI